MMDKSSNQFNRIVWIIIVLSILIRTLFIIDTKIDEYQFDMGIGKITSESSYDELYVKYDKGLHEGRHINYIMRLYNNEGFPEKIMGQFYHPPLHHFIMAMWLKVMDKVFTLSSVKLESMQFIALLYSIVIIVSFKKILDELEIKPQNQIIPLLLLGTFPLFVYLSGFINNDSLVTMCTILSILYLIKWNKEQTIKNTLFLSVFFGLGLMTKSIIILLIVPIIYIYFKQLNRNVTLGTNLIKLIIELLIFSCITLILGFWFHFYNLLNGKNSIGIIMPFEYLNLKDFSYWQRFGISNVFKGNYYNVWNYLLNSSFDLGIIKAPVVLQSILLLFTILFFIISIYYSFKNKNIILFLTYIIWWIGYFYLNIDMPYICSMHPRYMIVPFLINVIFIANGLQNEKNKAIKTFFYINTSVFALLNIIYIFQIIC